METDYSIWKDLFDTIQSFPNWLKFAAMLIPAATLITITQQFFTYRLRRAGLERGRTDSPPPHSPPSPPPVTSLSQMASPAVRWGDPDLTRGQTFPQRLARQSEVPLLDISEIEGVGDGDSKPRRN